MRVVSYCDGHKFWRQVATPLLKLPVLNNVFIGVAGRSRDSLQNDHFRAGVFDGDTLVLGVLRTPPHRLNLAQLGQGLAAIDSLVRHLADTEIEIPGVVGEQSLAEAFAERWSLAADQAVGLRPVRSMTMNLYEVTRVVPSVGIAGAMRQARASERELILRWEMAFSVDADLPEVERERDYVTRLVDEGLKSNTFFVWEVKGEAVASARLRLVAEAGARVSGVYTPKERRGRGYASALTAAISERVLMSGRWCCLFADANNSLTNRIYQRIGYTKVATFADIMFSDT